MSDIFISYRRGTASPYARGIYERLGRQFGAERVFMDIDTMEPGVDFVEYIKTAVGSCRVLIVVIGPDWVETADDSGRRRLDDPDDFVRVEVTAAFERGDVRVIPVLVGGAPPPKKDDLPPDLSPLTRRHALEVTDGRWDYDLGVLVKTITRVFAAPEPPAPEPPAREAEVTPTQPPATEATRSRRNARVPVAVAAVTLAVVAVAAVLLVSGGDDGGTTSQAAAIPKATSCDPVKNGWMVPGLGAQVQYRCELKPRPPSGNLQSSTLTYGLFASADEARKRFDEGLLFEEEEKGAELCSKSVRDRMGEILSEGHSSCFVHEREYGAIWWNGNGSRRLYEVQFDPSTKPEDAVQEWEGILSEG